MMVAMKVDSWEKLMEKLTVVWLVESMVVLKVD